MTEIVRQNRGRQLKFSVWSRWLTSLFLALLALSALAAPAAAETRALRLYFIHTKEKAEIVYKRNGRYDSAGLAKINRFLRDWRRNEPTKMDPRLLDLIWEVYRQSGSRDYIHVVSAYRSPATNSMLRSRSKGVAKKSQHMLGKAMDFYLPDVPLRKLRNVGLKMQAGGVGYYPRSGSPFVHMDVGNVRHWPRMSRKELVSIFPDGKTLHVPSDGKPLPGFEQAVASYEARKKNGNLAVASAGSSRSGGLLAALFRRSADEEEESGGTMVAEAPAPKRAAKAPVRAPEPKPAVQPDLPQPDTAARPVEPAEQPEPAAETPETIIAALPARAIPVPGHAPRPEAVAAETQAQPEDVPFQVVAADDIEAVPNPDALREADQAALKVPLPTRRPSYQAPAQALARAESEDDQDDVSALLALVEPQDNKVDMPLPEARPIEQVAEKARTAVAAVALEQALADGAAEDGNEEPYVVAALPEPRPQLSAPSDKMPVAVAPAAVESAAPPAVPAPRTQAQQNPFGSAPADVLAVPSNGKPAGKGARIASAANAEPLRSVASEMRPGTDATETVGSVKTTPKAAKPVAQHRKAEPKPMVVSPQPQTARLAFSAEQMMTTSASTTAPAFAYNIVRTAPREVYTAGFQQAAAEPVANRFTGKAVTFLSVARFDSE